jgi:hypothetical protein
MTIRTPPPLPPIGNLTFTGPDTNSPEAKGIYPSPNIACYLRYPCTHCERKFFIVSPITFLAGGFIQREVLERDKNGEITKSGRTFATCRACLKDIAFRERNKDFLI